MTIEVQFDNAHAAIAVVPVIVIVEIAVPCNAASPILLTCVILIVVNPAQSVNAPVPILVIVSGNIIEVNVDPLNVPSGIDVILVAALKSTVKTFEFANAPAVNVVPKLAVTVVTADPIDPAVIETAGIVTTDATYVGEGTEIEIDAPDPFIIPALIALT